MEKYVFGRWLDRQMKEYRELLIDKGRADQCHDFVCYLKNNYPEEVSPDLPQPHKLQRQVWCTLQFVAFHKWPDATWKAPQVHYLASLHRHVFHVKAVWTVTDNDRQIEFITTKIQLEQLITSKLRIPSEVETWSCESWAQFILEATECCEVTVSEDSENGATVRRIG